MRTFRTPHGHTVSLECRDGTNDAMVAEAVIEHDEYETGKLRDLDGWVVDVGAHIGSWAAMMLADHPKLKAIALEPLPVNADLISIPEDRGEVMVAALSKGKAKVKVHHDFSGGDMEQMHRYIGNQQMPKGTKGKTIEAAPVTVAALVKACGGAIEVMKLDCEGGEKALIGADLSHIRLLVGEYHIDRKPLVAHLEKTHKVTVSGSQTFGAFKAERK